MTPATGAGPCSATFQYLVTSKKSITPIFTPVPSMPAACHAVAPVIATSDPVVGPNSGTSPTRIGISSGRTSIARSARAGSSIDAVDRDGVCVGSGGAVRATPASHIATLATAANIKSTRRVLMPVDSLPSRLARHNVCFAGVVLRMA